MHSYTLVDLLSSCITNLVNVKTITCEILEQRHRWKCEMTAIFNNPQSPPWCSICRALYIACRKMISFGFNHPVQVVWCFQVLIYMKWCIPSDVLIMSFCSRHVSAIMWKLFQELSSVRDPNDPKGISRHLSWRWRRGCEGVEQQRLFLYICMSVHVWVFA